MQVGIRKACNFYVSEWHLFAAMLPYMREEFALQHAIVILSQENLKIGIAKMLQKMEVAFPNPNGLEDVYWCRDWEELEIENSIYPMTIFVQGTMEYIEEMKEGLEKILQKKYREIRIINCYELYDSNNSLYEILDKHEWVFNTGGLKLKESVFPDYREARLSSQLGRE